MEVFRERSKVDPSFWNCARQRSAVPRRNGACHYLERQMVTQLLSEMNNLGKKQLGLMDRTDSHES